MSTQDEIKQVEDRVKSLGLNMAFVLKRAVIPASTWARWKNATQGPTKEKWDAVIAELEDLERRLA